MRRMNLVLSLVFAGIFLGLGAAFANEEVYYTGTGLPFQMTKRMMDSAKSGRARDFLHNVYRRSETLVPTPTPVAGQTLPVNYHGSVNIFKSADNYTRAFISKVCLLDNGGSWSLCVYANSTANSQIYILNFTASQSADEGKLQALYQDLLAAPTAPQNIVLYPESFDDSGSTVSINVDFSDPNIVLNIATQ